MLRMLSRGQAMILTLCLALACAWAAYAPERPPSGAAAQGSTYSDLKLYHDVAARVAAGDDYYAAATELHRAHGFPTRPFITIRPPTLAHLGAVFGWQKLQYLLGAFLLAAAMLWYHAFRQANLAERIAVAVFVLAGGAMASRTFLVAQHELWAGLLLALALPLVGSRHWIWALLFAAGALAIRELALPFVLLALAFAVVRKRWPEAAGWSALALVFAGAMAAHAAAVSAHALPGDLPSQGWDGLRGALAPLRDLVDVSLLNRLPASLAAPAALLALLGWAAAPVRQACFALLWFLGYALMLALFARGQNFYWAIVLLPAWFIGFAFLPRALIQLTHAMLASRRSAL